MFIRLSNTGIKIFTMKAIYSYCKDRALEAKSLIRFCDYCIPVHVLVKECQNTACKIFITHFFIISNCVCTIIFREVASNSSSCQNCPSIFHAQFIYIKLSSLITRYFSGRWIDFLIIIISQVCFFKTVIFFNIYDEYYM